MTGLKSGGLFARRHRAVLLVLVLAAGFQALPLSTAPGRELTPAEMIEEGLPARKTMKSAAKKDFLAAICGAVQRHRGFATAITSVAIAARHEDAGDVVGAVLRCSGKNDCDFVGTIVAAAVAANRSAATNIGDAAIARAPDCGETIQGASRRSMMDGDGGEAVAASPAEQSPLIGTSAGADEGFDPHEQLSLVCENGTQRAVRESQLANFLHTHPGAFPGSCPPAASPSPSPSPSPLPVPLPTTTPGPKK